MLAIFSAMLTMLISLGLFEHADKQIVSMGKPSKKLTLGASPGVPKDLQKQSNLSDHDLERMRQAAQSAALQRLRLQQAHDANMAQILALSNISANGHEVNMMIINNMRPAGRYEYNPSTGRYDRFVPGR
jgi:hypothetical protein